MFRNSLTIRKLAQVLTDGGKYGFESPDRFVDALQVIQALGRVQRMFYRPGLYIVILTHTKRRSRYSLRIKCNVSGAFDFGIGVRSHAVVADPGATMTFVAGGALKPIGGHILSHASATRMFLRKGSSRKIDHCAETPSCSRSLS